MREPSVGVVIPTYNEVHNIGSLIIQLNKSFKEHKISILVVDDGSLDGTGKVVTSLKDHFDVDLIDRRNKKGLGTAIIEGLKASLTYSYNYIVTMDADFSHDPRDAPRLVEACNTSDISLGSRYVKGGKVYGTSVLRRFVSYVGNISVSSLLGMNVLDCTSGFKCYKTDVIKCLVPCLKSKGFDIQIELLYRAIIAGYTVNEVPIVFRNRSLGKSKINPYEIAKCLSVFKNCSKGRIISNS